MRTFTFRFKQFTLRKMVITLVTLLFYTLIIQAQNGALHFDGIDDEVVSPTSTALELNNTSFTLEAWINASSWKNNIWEGNIINKEENSNNSGYMLRVGDGGNVNFNFGDGLYNWQELTTTNNPLSLNTWYHIAGVWNNTTKEATIYIDGVIAITTTFTGYTVASNSQDLYIGEYTGNNRNFNGIIDDVRIWNLVRTPTEITNNKDMELLGTETGLVAYYKFNEGAACGNNTTNTSVTDSSPSGSSGTLNNFGLVSGSSTSNFTEGVFLSSCTTPPDPSALSGSVVGNTANLSWTENGTSTTWDIEYGTNGYVQGTGTEISGVTNPYDLTGLAAYTSYDYYVRSSCGCSKSAWVGPYNFSTTCSTGPSSLLPANVQLVNEDFESGLGSFTSTTSGNDPFATGDATSASSTYWTVPSNSSNFAFINDDDCDCNSSDVKLISPVLDLTGSTNTYMTFDYLFRGVSSFDIVVSIDGGSTWSSTILSIANSTTWVNGINVPLSAYNGESNVKIAFLYNDGGSWAYGAAVDNVEIWTESSTEVQTTTNSSSGSAEHYLGAGDIAHFYDQNTGNIICTIDNSASTHDYGCTTVEVDRAGTGAVEFVNTDTDSYMFSKSLKITPSNNTSNDISGGYTITLYYSDAEMLGWEAATGESRNNIELHKVDGDNHIYDVTAGNPSGLSITSSATSYAMFNSDHALSATFANGFSGFGAGVPSSPLPVELTYFQAEKDGKTSLLTWETATEENNKGFHIERSTNGFDFETIGWMDGFGTSTAVNEYRFADIQPAPGVNYYRLLQEDFDGTTSYSDTRTVLFKTGLEIFVYPNPNRSGQNTTIQLYTDQDQDINISIYNALGTLVHESNIDVSEGNNTIPLSTDRLSNGVYFISVQNSGTTESIKLQILK